MASFAIRMSLLNHKRIRFFLFWLTGSCTFRARCRRAGGIKEWVATFRAKEMEFVVESLAEDRVVESDEAGLDNGGLAVMAPVCEFLNISK
jgi:hypothetical protein